MLNAEEMVKIILKEYSELSEYWDITNKNYNSNPRDIRAQQTFQYIDAQRNEILSLCSLLDIKL